MALDPKYVWIKVEPPSDSTAGLYTEPELESVPVGLTNHVKAETESDSEVGQPGVSEQNARADIYLKHEIKTEATVKSEDSSLSDLSIENSEFNNIKAEAESENEEYAYGVSAAATRAGLYLKHEVKDELVVGPEEYQRPEVPAKCPAPLNMAERTCSVELEYMDVDLQRRVCRIGPYTYKFRLCLNEYDAAKNKLRSKTQYEDNIEQAKSNIENRRKQKKRLKQNAYHCPHCNFTSLFKEYIRVHKKIAHVGERPHKCQQCEYTCYNKYSLQAHIRATHNEIVYRCDQCSDTFELKKQLLSHTQAHLEHPHTCTGKSNHKRLYKLHAGQKPYKCEKCYYASARINEMQSHVIARHLHRCDHYRKERSQAHNRMHFASKSKDYSQVVNDNDIESCKYKCDLCSYGSSREDLLQIHTNMMHVRILALE